MARMSSRRAGCAVLAGSREWSVSGDGRSKASAGRLCTVVQGMGRNGWSRMGETPPMSRTAQLLLRIIGAWHCPRDITDAVEGVQLESIHYAEDYTSSRSRSYTQARCGCFRNCVVGLAAVMVWARRPLQGLSFTRDSMTTALGSDRRSMNYDCPRPEIRDALSKQASCR